MLNLISQFFFYFIVEYLARYNIKRVYKILNLFVVFLPLFNAKSTKKTFIFPSDHFTSDFSDTMSINPKTKKYLVITKLNPCYVFNC